MLIPITIGLAIGLFLWWANDSAYDDWKPAIIIAPLVCLFIWALVSCSIGSGSSKYVVLTEEGRESQPIVSLKFGAATAGSFSLGSGSIENSPVYYYYTRSGQRLKLDWVKCEKSVLIEGDTRPSITTITYDRRAKNSGWLWGWLPIGDTIVSYEIHIPQGSVVQQFTP